MDTNLTEIARFGTLREFDSAKAALIGSGITVESRNDNTVSADPYLSNAVGGIVLLVPNADAARATSILEPKLEADDDGNYRRRQRVAGRVFLGALALSAASALIAGTLKQSAGEGFQAAIVVFVVSYGCLAAALLPRRESRDR